MVGGWKSERIEKILFSLLFVWLRVKKWRDEENGFEYIYLYTLGKEWCPIKTKKIKIMSQKKSRLLKKKKTHTQPIENQKKKKRIEKATLLP